MLRNIINLGGRLLLICLVAALALAVTNSITAPVKAANAEAKAQQALLAVYPDAEFTKLSAEEVDHAKATTYRDNIQELYTANDGGMIVVLTVQGYHEMRVMVGVKPDGTTTGYQVLAHSETANLGDRVTKEAFMAQFRGQKTPVAYGEGVEAVSGATFSSTGILNAVNTAAEVAQLLGGAQ